MSVDLDISEYTICKGRPMFVVMRLMASHTRIDESLEADLLAKADAVEDAIYACQARGAILLFEQADAEYDRLWDAFKVAWYDAGLCYQRAMNLIATP